MTPERDFDEGAQYRIGSLLIVRYCGWYGDARFSPWFEEHRGVMAALASTALAVAQGRQNVNALLELKPDIERLLDAADPDTDDFGTAVGDHLNLADETSCTSWARRTTDTPASRTAR